MKGTILLAGMLALLMTLAFLVTVQLPIHHFNQGWP